MSKTIILFIALFLTTSIVNGQSEDKLLKVGDYAPDFSTITVDGKPFKLSELRGKYVLLNFWGTWCNPCIGEIPDLRDIQFLYDRNELEIVSISVEPKQKNIKLFTDSAGMKWTNISELMDEGFQNSIASLYGVAMYPTNYLIDKEGKICVFPISFWSNGSGKLKMLSFQSSYLYQMLTKYLGESKNVADYVSQSKGALFSLVQGNAKSVSLAGSFNQWAGKQMFKVNDKWVRKVDLPPGTYQYKYIVDGKWIVDPTNTNILDDGKGNINSQIIIK